MADVAIAHKDYLVRGGGERVAEHLARLYDAPLFYGGRGDGVELEYDDTREVNMTSRQRWLWDRGGTCRSVVNMVAWENETRLAEYDTIITSGNEPLWYVPTPEQTVVAYCHSPPRVLYDLNHETGVGTLGTLLRAFKRAFFAPNVARPDHWIANSDHVARRLTRYFGVERDRIDVVYPPVDVDGFDADDASEAPTPPEPFYLYLGRLTGHKRVATAIKACERLGVRLAIAGRGPARDDFEAVGSEHTTFLGYVSEERKRALLADAEALLMPAQREDFGIVPVEALAAGTPVIGVEEGMTKHQIRPGETGYYARPTPTGFARAIERLHADGLRWTPAQRREFARVNFGHEAFRDGVREAVATARDRATVEPELSTPTLEDRERVPREQ